MSALEVAEGQGGPTGAEFLGKIRCPVGEGDLMETSAPGKPSLQPDCSCLHIGEGSGTPLQYSCLENPLDGGAW